MASNHTADPSSFSSVISMLDGSDVMSATQLRAILEALHDNTANNHSRSVDQHLRGMTAIVNDDTPPGLGSNGLGLAFAPEQRRYLLVGGGSVTDAGHEVSDLARGVTVTDLTNVAQVRSAAYDPVAGRAVIVGVVSPYAAHTTDFGTTWTEAGTPPGSARHSVVWDATNSLFIATQTGDSSAYTSPTGAVWTSRALGAAATGGVAVTTGGLGCVARGSGATITFATATNGITWTATGGTFPDVANFSGAAGLAALGTTLYACGIHSSGEVRVFSSTLGVTWTLLASITPPNGTTPSSVRLLADPYSQALYLVVATTGSGAGTYVWASLDGGANWSDSCRLLANILAVQAGGGRLFSGSGTSRYMSTNPLSEVL